MVSAYAGTGATMVICADGGEKSVNIADVTSPDKKTVHRTSTCPYAHVGFGTDLTAAPLTGVLVVTFTTHMPVITDDAQRTATLLRPPPIGPPAFVLI